MRILTNRCRNIRILGKEGKMKAQASYSKITTMTVQTYGMQPMDFIQIRQHVTLQK